MYGVVMMAALTMGGDTPEFGKRGYWAAHGCVGGCYGCYGCYGGCVGGNGHSYRAWPTGDCYGGRWGHPYSCYGCYGCYGGCYGGATSWGPSYGCAGVFYMAWPPPVSIPAHGCYGLGCQGAGVVMPSAIEPAPDTKMPKANSEESSSLGNRARVIVEVPADARLWIDDQPTRATSSVRTFNTPELEKGQTYYYEVKVEIVRDGQKHAETRKLLIQPGKVARVSFMELEAVAAAKKQSTTVTSANR